MALLLMLMANFAGAPAASRDHNPTPPTGAGGSSSARTRPLSAEEQKRFAQGEELFHACLSCHGLTGEGLPGQYPPLKGSEIVLGSPGRLARVLLNGLEGPTIVLGSEYDAPMPPAPLNDDDEVAAVMTFIRRAWGNRASPVTPADVAKVREATKDRSTSWTWLELEKIAD